MGEWFLVFSQLYYTISGEELFIFYNKKEPYLCGLWRFANAYITYKERGSYEKEKSKTDTGNAAFPGADYNNRYIPISNGFCNNGPKYFYILIEYCISPNK